jgi:hypothetical protein
METRREWLATMRTGLMTAVVSPLADPRSSDEGPRAGQGGGRNPGSPERLSLDYAPAPVPPQGRGRIYGIGLPEAILRQVYHDNAARLLGLDPL